MEDSLIDSQTGIAVTIVGMVLASLGASITAMFTYLSSRDKARFEADVLKIKSMFDSELIVLKAAVDECDNDRRTQKEELALIRSKAELAEHKAAAGEGELRAAERAIKDLRGEVMELRGRLYGRPSNDSANQERSS